MKTLAYATVGLALAAATSVALADDDDPGKRHGGAAMRGAGMMLHMLDTDMDQSVSIEEFLNLHGQRFANADADGDGEIDAAEVDAVLAARLEAMRSRYMERLDEDGNGSISREEFEAPMRERFSMMDSDDDGALDRSDLRGHSGEDRDRRHWRRGHHRGEEGRRGYREKSGDDG